MPPRKRREEPPFKAKKIEIRVDSELAKRAQQKALRYGGLSAVVRALLRQWVERDAITLTEDDIARENERAPKDKPKQKQTQL